MTEPRSQSDRRSQIVEIAKSWIGTNFHDGACIKGVGVDCAMLVRAIYVEAGIIPPVEIKPYPPSWYLHREEELFLHHVMPLATEVSEDRAEKGDLVLFKFGRCFSHGAILINRDGAVIHATQLSRGVVEGNRHHGELQNRPSRFFSFLD